MGQEMDQVVEELNEKLLEARSVAEAEQLLAQGAQLSARSWTKDTPLHSACSNGILDLVRFYISKGIAVSDKGSFCREPLSAAVSSMSSQTLDLVKMLVEEYGANINSEDEDGDTALNLACLNTSDWALAEYLVDKGASIEHVNKKGMTPFLCACGFAGNGIGIARPLAKRGADITKLDAKGNTALHLACTSPNGKVDLVKWLIKTGKFDIHARNADGKTPMMLAAGYGASWDSAAVIKYLLHKGADISVRDKGGRSILHAAVDFGAQDYETVKLILSKGLDVNCVDDNGETPVYLLVSKNGARFEIFQLLVKHGANLNLKPRSGFPLLHMLAKMVPFHGVNTMAHFLKLIMDEGGDLNQKDAIGQTAIIWAERDGNTDFVDAWNHAKNGTLEEDPDLLQDHPEPEPLQEGDSDPDLEDYPDSDAE